MAGSIKAYEDLDTLYKDLDHILLNTWDNSRNINNKVQKKLLDIEKIKKILAKKGVNTLGINGIARGIANLYPDIRQPDFNIALTQHPLVKQYSKVLSTKEIADRVYKTYFGITDDKPDKGKIPAFGDPENIIDKAKVPIFIHSSVQKMLRNFMSPNTPYRGLIVIHGTGVGKTCTSITIAEALKDYEVNHGTKIYVIREAEFKRQIFDKNTVAQGMPQIQCTGETYLDEISNTPQNNDAILGCQKGRPDDCARMDREIKKVIRKYYDFNSDYLWAKKIAGIIRDKTRGLEGLDKHQKTVNIIRQVFNNSVLIIDEAHNLRNMGTKIDVADNTPITDDADLEAELLEVESLDDNTPPVTKGAAEDKLVSMMLNKVLMYSQNMRLILLSATPMYDKPQDILPLLNYILLNDKRPRVTDREIFDQDGNITHRDKLIEACRGYISYVRGNDPINFPLRLNASVNLSPAKIFDTTHYPKYDILGRETTQTVKYLKLVNCPLSNKHQSVLLSLINYNTTTPNRTTANKSQSKSSASDTGSTTSVAVIEEIDLVTGDEQKDMFLFDANDAAISEPNFSVAFTKELQTGNFIYKTLDEVDNQPNLCYGGRGFQNTFQRIPGQQSFKFRDDKFVHKFMGEGLKESGPKIYECLQNIQKSQGPAFIYSFYIDGGILPMAIALELAGYTRYGGERPLLDSKYKPSGPSKGEYILYIGNKQFSRGASKYFDMRKAMVNEKNVKVVLASQKGSEGLNLFGFREIHILDPWHNINLLEQTIGRVIRNESHNHLPPEKRNVCVYMYTTTLSGQYKAKESIDLHVYAICESKAVKSGIVELILKENAIDCQMNKPLNYRAKSDYQKQIDIVTSHGIRMKYNLWDEPFSRDSLYMASSNYKCISETGVGDGVLRPSSRDILTISNRILSKNIDMYQLEINEIIAIINAKLKSAYNLLGSDIWDIISEILHLDRIPDDIEMAKNIFAYLADYYENENIFVLDQYARECKIIITRLNNKTGGSYILRLLPLSDYNKNIPIANQEKFGFAQQLFNFSRRKKPSAHQFAEEPSGLLPINLIQINPLVQTLRKEKIKLLDKEELKYNLVLGKLETKINNIIHKNKPQHDDNTTDTEDFTFDTSITITPKYGYLEIHKIIFDRLVYVEKIFILQNLVAKIRYFVPLTAFEKILIRVCRFNLVSKTEIFKTGLDGININLLNEPDEIYGFLIARFHVISLYRLENITSTTTYNDNNIKNLYIEDKTKIGSLLDKRWRWMQEGKLVNNLFGYLIYTKRDNLPPIFKITDYLTKGFKKSVKGASCNSKPVNEIIDYIKIIEPLFSSLGFKHSTNKRLVCGDLELFFRSANEARKNGRMYFLNPEEYYIWQLNQ